MAATLLNAVTATGAGSWYKTYKTKTHTVVYTFTGAITALTINFEGTIDGGEAVILLDNHQFSAAEIAAGQASIFLNNLMVSKVRANVIALTGVGAITCRYEGASENE